MYDFCINGGGMVGAALALGLAQQNYRVVVIEPNQPNAFEVEQGPDLRVSAISEASVTLLKALGAWTNIEKMRLKPYVGLSVWDNPKHRTDFTAKSIDVPQLGYFVENRLLQLACHEALTQHENVTIIFNEKIDNIALSSESSSSDLTPGSELTHSSKLTPSPKTDNNPSIDEESSSETSTLEQSVCITLSSVSKSSVTESSNTQIQAKWLIGADGARSQVRQFAGIGTSGWQYGQQAMGITVKMAKETQAITWQQFTPTGPKAFLPMFDEYASLVWYNSPEELKRLKGLNSTQLKNEVINAFPNELTQNENDFSIIDKAAFPLTRMHASEYVRERVILIGDAAHTINPLAGQGVNIGFRDVQALLEVTAKRHDVTSQVFFKALKNDYEKPRKRDNLLMMSAMDGFYTLFSNDIAPIKWIRNQLLSVAERAGPIKKEVLKYAIGMR
ncbi:FAD-dependent monooxygenase [Alteromonas sp. BMJM2]|uniref:FAD-dependent monooxygenase n=1 Tax=Alteromonas sp. BMJM2 TaxID=2954241 RepID=UPI0022B48292|nr:FAD-dependent monooxygenase [Alteromonas sp. BMJM2]